MFFLFAIVVITCLAIVVGFAINAHNNSRKQALAPRKRTEFENNAIRLATEIIAAEKYGWTAFPDEITELARTLERQTRELT